MQSSSVHAGHLKETEEPTPKVTRALCVDPSPACRPPPFPGMTRDAMERAYDWEVEGGLLHSDERCTAFPTRLLCTVRFMFQLLNGFFGVIGMDGSSKRPFSFSWKTLSSAANASRCCV